MFIRSDRLFLRPGWPEDSGELLARIADEKVVRHLANVPWPYTAQDARNFLDVPESPLLPRFLVTVPQAGAGGARLIGGCGLSLVGDEASLGYWIAWSEWGKGYATEAARAVLGLARALGHRRVVARHHIDNAASGRVLEKAGLRRTGHIVEAFSRSRGHHVPAHEYEIVFDAPADRGGDDEINRLRAA